MHRGKYIRIPSKRIRRIELSGVFVLHSVPSDVTNKRNLMNSNSYELKQSNE